MARTSAPSAPTSSKRREEILEVAAKVFGSKGIAGTTVRDIADEAGILSGSLYHHFESKDQMVVDILLPLLQRQHAAYAAIVASLSDPAEVLRELISVGLQGVAASPYTARMLHNEAVYFQTNESLRVVDAARQKNRLLWISVLKKGIRSGAFRRGLDADVVVRAIFDTVYSATRWLPPRGTSTPEKIADQLSRLFLDGLRP